MMEENYSKQEDMNDRVMKQMEKSELVKAIILQVNGDYEKKILTTIPMEDVP